MKLKLDADGHAIIQDGRPVYVHDDGKEVALDYQATLATISRLNGEAKSHRERAETAEEKLKSYSGIENTEAALRALEVVRNLDDKKLVDAGEVEKVKQAAIAAHEQKIQAMSVAHANELKSWEKKYGDLDSTYKGEKIGGLFKGSKFIAEKIAIPADIVQARFGSDFKIEDAGKVVAYDSSGNKIFSRTKPGEPADFDEALEMLIEQYPRRDDILKGSGHSGDGARNGGGGPINGKKKSDFKSEKDRSAFVNEHGLDAYKALPA